MKRSLAAAVLALLCAPAAAQADTTTVDPTSTATCARGGTCATISAAENVSQANDTIDVKAGVYAENVTTNVAGLKITGTPGYAIAGAGSGTTPSLSVTGGDLTLSDATVVSFTGPAISVSAGAANRIQRSTVFGAGDAVTLAASGMGERRLTIDSSILASSGGKAVKATTAMLSGDAFLTLNHVTAAAGGIALEGGQGPLTPGDITAAINASIIRGDSTAAGFAGTPPLVAANAVTATYVNSDAPKMTVSGPATSTGEPASTFPDAQVFAEKSRLKATSPAIDKGGALISGESATDIDGDPRVAGSASDIGADEYVNKAPALTLAVAKGAGDVVTATGTATDANGKSDVTRYDVTWGDGTPAETNATGVFSHTYAASGTYEVTMTATDAGGLASAAAKQSVTVADTTPPRAEITSPKAAASVALSGKAKKQLKIKGVTTPDATGVEVAITRRAGGCAHYNGTAFVAGSCKQPVYVAAAQKSFRFSLTTVKLLFKKGAYQVRARATDAAGNKSAPTKAAKSLVAFKVS